MEKYTQLRVVGEGSFGRAVLVQSKNSEEKYVIKDIQLPKKESKLQDSRKEAILLSRMKHPNIVAFRESFELNDLLCIVMEYCSGGDLLQRIQQQKTTNFCTENILRWFAQMCAGAQHIHDKRVLHRDLKSKNIFLAGDGSIKLGDFGSACVLNSSKAYAHAYVGTPFYVAPEIWDNKPYNNKSDVWSLGCVLYELCTLQHPFQASSWKSLILKVCRGAYPPLPRHLPYELMHLIKQMFKTNPKDRPSVQTILTSHRVSKLLRSHLPSQALEKVKDGRRPGRWNREEGAKMAQFLGDKSLQETSTFGAAVEFPKTSVESEKPGPRRQWTTDPPDSVLQAMANASLLSSDSMASSTSIHGSESEDRRRRRLWDKDPPQKLLSILEKAQLNKAFSTYLINITGNDPLMGPLSQPQGDESDGPEPEVAVDEDRLQPRSDDEDTDFEEESPCDWMEEVEKMFSEH
ncbi:serine/threonine-protein kinase Nek3 isoform X1 [Oryzias melastigma]|uniref:NIMA related kinase 3 n=1 Tax=Oryzias melastigma TaxID=30732 RepID=A0A3B3B5S4_ORYME|nr:serine/threonine-protein kinase Nek3 isoform X1 [Oryzias melastigma]XP_024132491.1 serine/threonine-protein kinase Nek3 isoform X1 [Oryzias melastigma]